MWWVSRSWHSSPTVDRSLGGQRSGSATFPRRTQDFVAVAGGDVHSLACKSDGSIVAWGATGAASADVPAPNAGFVAVAGGGHSLGLRADGSIVAWGTGTSYGQCNVPAPNAGFGAVAGGAYHSLRPPDRRVLVAWGDNGNGQCSVPAPNPASSGRRRRAAQPWPQFRPGPRGAGWTTATGSAPCADQPGIWQALQPAVRARAFRAPAVFVRISSSARFTADACALVQRDLPGQRDALRSEPVPRPHRGGWRDPHVSRLQVLTAPNPSAGGVVIRCLLPTRAQTTVVLFDASGRMVRRLHEGDLPAGETPLSWDGRDDAGREVPAGVYLVKVTTPAGETSGRVVLTR